MHSWKKECSLHPLLCLSVNGLYSLFAGEWISGATCMYIAEYLAEQYGKEDRVCHNECMCDTILALSASLLSIGDRFA